MVLLTVVRRAAIIIITVALLVDSCLLVLAKKSQERKSVGPTDSFKIKAYVDSKGAATDLVTIVTGLKLEPPAHTNVSKTTKFRHDPTGQWMLVMRFKTLSQVNSIASTFKHVGVDVVVDKLDDGSKMIKYRELFNSEADAKKKAKEISAKVPFQMAAEPYTKKVSYTAWCVEAAVGDAASLDSIRSKWATNKKIQIEQE